MNNKLNAVRSLRHGVSISIAVAGCSLLAQGCSDDVVEIETRPDGGLDASNTVDSVDTNDDSTTTPNNSNQSDSSVIDPNVDQTPSSDAGADAATSADAGAIINSPDAEGGVVGLDAGRADSGVDGPANQGPSFPHEVGSASFGQEVFRFGTFGNEGFWTDAARLPQGIVAAGLTPVQALQAGLSVNVDALDDDTKNAVAAELATEGTDGPLLNDPATTIALIQANAVIGVVFKDTDDNGTLDLAAGDKIGVSCALCHAITDGSIVPNAMGGGSIGVEVDGQTPHNLNVGGILALAENSRAFYPLLQVKLEANNDTSIGRAPFEDGLTETSTEEEVDAYLSNPNYYPLGTFDDAPDGNGAPQQIQPFFRTDLSAPFGTPGDIARLDNFNNLVYTALLDPTTLITPAGRNFLMALGGQAAGQELADDYEAILLETGVLSAGDGGVGLTTPFVLASLPEGVVAGTEDAPVGLRIDEQALLDLNAYTDTLAPPDAESDLDAELVNAGRELFRANCTDCHNTDQSVPVPSFVVPLAELYPGYSPVVLAARELELPFRPLAFAPLQDDPSTIFDDKTAVVEASRRGEVRGSALPLLLGLAGKDRFLHDGSVIGLDMLVNPERGSEAPHPFYVESSQGRTALVEFLKSLEIAE